MLVVCFPLGLAVLWTHPTWSIKTKQVVSAVVALAVVMGIVTTASGSEERSSEVAADTDGEGSDEGPTSETREEPLPVESTTTTRPATTTTAAPPTTIDPEVLRGEYDAQVETSCGLAAAASLAIDDETAAALNGSDYDRRWEPHAPESRFREDVAYCAHHRREERRITECREQPDVELLARDPDRFVNDCYTLVFNITQFDQATGRCGFRARFDTTMREWNFEYKGDNSIVLYDDPCPQLDPIGVDDVIRTRAVVLGGLTYDTAIGGSATAVQFIPVGDPEMLQDN